MSKRYFVCSDVHSFYNPWMQALADKGFVESDKDHIIILCGDLFDRGPQSILCYEFVKDMLNSNRFIYIRGNHEDLLFQCIDAIRKRQSIAYHHSSNGTLKTLAEFVDCTEYDLIHHSYDGIKFDNITNKLEEFINKNAVNYFELGNKIFVHSTIPVHVNADQSICFDENWKNGCWTSARWGCPFDLLFGNNLVPEGKTIVSGHWHTSYMWAQIKNTSEWGLDAIFDPFISDTLIAIDGCVGYSGQVNVLEFDEGGNLIG